MIKKTAENQGSSLWNSSDVYWTVLIIANFAAAIVFGVVEISWLGFATQQMSAETIITLILPIVFILIAIVAIIESIKKKSRARSLSVILHLLGFSVATAIFQRILPVTDTIGWALIVISLAGIAGVLMARANNAQSELPKNE